MNLAAFICLICMSSFVLARLPPREAAPVVTPASEEEEWNNRPIVGILTQAGLDEDTFVPRDGSYIAGASMHAQRAAVGRAILQQCGVVTTGLMITCTAHNFAAIRASYVRSIIRQVCREWWCTRRASAGRHAG